jgi:hypothetical protein
MPEYWATPAAALVDSSVADAPVAAADAPLVAALLAGAAAEVDELPLLLQAASARVSAPRQATLKAFTPCRFRWGVYVIVWALQRNLGTTKSRQDGGTLPAGPVAAWLLDRREADDRFDVHVLFR